MSEFRDRVIRGMIDAVGHPIPVHAGLKVLQEALVEKIDNAVAEDLCDEEFIDGLREAKALISNLRQDVARDYGIEEG